MSERDKLYLNSVITLCLANFHLYNYAKINQIYFCSNDYTILKYFYLFLANNLSRNIAC